MTIIRVDYTRTETGGQGSGVSLNGAVELNVDPDKNWVEEWGAAYGALRAQVDSAFSESPPTAPEPDEDPADATDEVSQAPAIVPGVEVEYTGCRIMFDIEHKPATAQRRENARMRIGNPAIPGQYVYAKSFEPDIIAEMKRLRKGDMVDITGHFDKPWTKRNPDGSSDTQYDLVIQSVARA